VEKEYAHPTSGEQAAEAMEANGFPGSVTAAT